VILAAVIGLAASELGHDKSDNTHGPLPYSFVRPVSWERDPNAEMAARENLQNVSAISRGSDGILIGTFTPKSRAFVIRSRILEYQLSGGTLQRNRAVKVDGIEGVQLDAAGDGVQDRTTILFASGTVWYWIDCLARSDHRATGRACSQVLSSFRLKRN
jgi:hypothetical protein